MPRTLEYQQVPIRKLVPYEKNPRRGNVKVIAESLEKHGQYKPIVVRKATNEVLAGNHTLMAAQQLGWKKLDVVYVDVDDITAAQIVLVDNRSSDLATYDTEVLAEVMQIIEDSGQGSVGTGYSDQDMKMILQAIEKGSDINLDSIIRPEAGEDPLTGRSDFDDVPLGDEDVDERLSEEEQLAQGKPKPPERDKFNDADEELAGAFQLKDDGQFPGSGYWGIPVYRTDMFMSIAELEEIWPLESWAGSATKDWPNDDQWWLYNFGIDSTSGMKDVSKLIIAFYCWDDYFENWWHFPSRYVAKMLNSKIKYAVTPDFSLSDDYPRVANLWGLYRNRWLGRYFQEAGIKVVPNIGWRHGDPEFLTKLVLGGLPEGIPIIGMQAHTGVFEAKGEVTQEMIDAYSDMIRTVYDTLKPEALLLYGGGPGLRHMESLKLPWRIFYVENRLVKLAAKAKQRQKRTGL